MKRRFEHKVLQPDGGYKSQWEEYFDTNDPYQLIQEAREARAMLAEGFIQGSEFATGRDEEGDPINSVCTYDHPYIKYVCSIGAVFRIQGHHVYDCNLIVQLGKSAFQMTPEPLRPDIEDNWDDVDWGGMVVDLNDTAGKDAALAMFDHAIAVYQAQIDYAESMAADYMGAQPVSAPFRMSLPSPTINYGCGPNGCTPIPTKQEVPVQ